MLPIKSYKPEKICLIFKKKGKHSKKFRDLNKKLNQIQHTRKPFCRGSVLLSTKGGN